jgi:hypothetical protein
VPTDWTPDQLDAIEVTRELEITGARRDGTLRRWVPISVVRVAEKVYVRTWYRREGGWFGHAAGTGRARVRVPGFEADVVVEDVGAGDAALRACIEQAYRKKYGSSDGSVGQMTGEDAAASTLRLAPAEPAKSEAKENSATSDPCRRTREVWVPSREPPARSPGHPDKLAATRIYAEL